MMLKQTLPQSLRKLQLSEIELENDGDDKMQENILVNTQVLQENAQDSLQDNMDYDDTIPGEKWPHSTDSEDNVKTPLQRQKSRPVPNFSAAKKREKPSTKDQPTSK